MNLIDKFFNLKCDLELIGLIRRDRDSEGYFCTPVEAIIFAWSGTDGIHYCVIPKENDETLEDSPVYVINPSESEIYVEIAAKNLIDFLRIVISCKDAAVLGSIGYISEDNFNEFINQSWNDLLQNPDLNKKVEEIIAKLKEEFNITEIDEVYKHIQETRTNPNFYSKYSFSDEYYNLTGD